MHGLSFARFYGLSYGRRDSHNYCPLKFYLNNAPNATLLFDKINNREHQNVVGATQETRYVASGALIGGYRMNARDDR